MKVEEHCFWKQNVVMPKLDNIRSILPHAHLNLIEIVSPFSLYLLPYIDHYVSYLNEINK